MSQLHNELKKEFQLERLVLFSDAVFAIAITLLVLEIKIPEKSAMPEISDKEILLALSHLIPKFIGFVISFIFIGLYWTIHHRMFGFVTAYNKRLMVLNLIFLFFIVLMPFSTGLYSEFAGREIIEKQLKVPLTFYALNFAFAGLANFLMWREICNPKNKLAEPPVDRMIAKFAKLRSLIVPVIFLSIIPIAYFTSVMVAVYTPMLIPVFMKIAKSRINKNHKAPVILPKMKTQ